LQKPKEVACEVSRCTAAVLISCKGSNGGKDISRGLQRKERVRTWKESDREKGYYPLRTAEGRTCQDMERKPWSKVPFHIPGASP